MHMQHTRLMHNSSVLLAVTRPTSGQSAWIPGSIHAATSNVQISAQAHLHPSAAALSKPLMTVRGTLTGTARWCRQALLLDVNAVQGCSP